MRIPLGVVGDRWYSRTPTRNGHIDPPNWGNSAFLAPGATVQRRLDEQEADRQLRENNPHLQPGMLVILERAPWRVVEIREMPFDLWPAKFADRWKALFDAWARTDTDKPAPEQATWKDRPVNLVLAPDGGGKARHLAARASYAWNVLPEHYAVCRSCGELPPCREELMEKTVDRQVAKSDRLLSIPAGACMGCGEAISGRQKAVEFPGPNLWRLDLPEGTGRFHVRQECSGWVDRYREQWQEQGAPVSEDQPSLFGEGDVR